MILLHDRDLVLAKVATIERCVAAIREVAPRAGADLEEWIARDVVVLNLQRAIQAGVDLAQHLVGSNAWGLPRSSAEAFDILAGHGLIELEEAAVYRSMVGFRNISVHDYTRLDPAIIQSIVVEHLGELEQLARAIARSTVAGVNPG